MRECLMLNPPADILYYLGAHFKSGLIDVDQLNADQKNFNKHLEYYPMVNSRTHLLGKGRQILNTTFSHTYDIFLSSLVQKVQPATEDKLVFVYYLQLQDRVQEAMELFSKLSEPKDEDSALKI